MKQIKILLIFFSFVIQNSVTFAAQIENLELQLPQALIHSVEDLREHFVLHIT